MTQREKLIELIDKLDVMAIPTENFRHGLADYLIANGVVVREKGEWIEESGIQICPFCGEEHEWEAYRASFCDQCGADMRGGTNV